MSNKKNCYSCKFKRKDKEFDVINGCKVAKEQGNNTLLILGEKGICPYHTYEEYYGMK